MLRPPPKFEPPRSWFIKRTAHENILAQWRGIDLAEEEKAAKSNAKAAGTVMANVLKEIGLDRRQADLEILRVWNNLLDPEIARHAKPVGLFKGTLFVAVSSSTWLDEIVRWHRKDILKRLQTSFGPDIIQRISFRHG